jgi:hypothetical protein
MPLVKQLCSKILRASLMACGGLLVLTALGSAAYASIVGPEIDPGTLSSAMTLLVGGVLLLTSRRGRK